MASLMIEKASWRRNEGLLHSVPITDLNLEQRKGGNAGL